MSEKARSLWDAALALDPDDRRWLMEALLDSLDEREADEEGVRIAEERSGEVECDEATLMIADARWRKLEEDPDSWVSRDEVAKLLERK